MEESAGKGPPRPPKATLESADRAALVAGLTREDLLGELFHAGLLGYYAQLTGLAHVLGLRQHAHHALAVGTGTYGYELGPEWKAPVIWQRRDTSATVSTCRRIGETLRRDIKVRQE